MPKIEITRTELVWPGKYDEAGNLVQVERVNLTPDRIGKGARAHDVALATFRGTRKPDRRIGVEQLLAAC